MKKTTGFLILLIASINTFSQTHNMVLKEITYEKGLFGKGNYALLQDHKGFVWIGGYGGLQRYDGYEFKIYDENMLVLDINQDRRDLLWISTIEGIYLLNPEDEQTLNYAPSPEQKLGYISYNRINKTIEAKNRIIWCATQNGLLKLEPKAENEIQLKELIFKKGLASAFNISLFKIHETNDKAGDNRIFEVYEDDKERLWIGSSMGLFIFNSTVNEFIRIDNDPDGKTRLNHQHVFTIVEENPDVYWVRDLNGFTRISNIRKAISNISIDKEAFIFNNYIYRLEHDPYFIMNHFIIDRNNNFWVGTRSNGLVKMIINNNKNVRFEEVYAEMQGPAGSLYSEVTSIMEDRSGMLWACNQWSGIRTWREGNNLFTPLQEVLKENHWMKYEISQFIEDDDENLWICSAGNGLFKISREGHVINYIITDPTIRDTSGNYANSIVEIDKGKFWVATEYAIWQFDAITGKSKTLFKKFFDEEKSTSVSELRKIENNILIATQDQGFWVYNLKTNKLEKYTASQNDTLGLIDDFIYSMDVMKNGEIWVSTRRQGLNRLSLNKTTGECRFLPLPEAVKENLQIINEKRINHIYEAKNGLLWFCTQTGLVNLNLESGEIRKWTQKDGLSNNAVQLIEEDNNGYLWLGTDHGLSVLDPVTGIINTFDESDGLPKIQHGLISSLKTRKGLMYFGGMGEHYFFNPDKLLKNNVIPPVVLTDFRLFNMPVGVDSTRKAILSKNISYTREIHLKYNQNDLSFTFAALDYNDPTKNRYAYILQGYQDAWIETGADNRIAAYTNLNPGEYVFRVKGSNNNGVWNEEGTFVNIIIHPPFWKTTWAYIAYAILFLLLLRGYIYWRTRRIRKEKMVLEKQVTDRTVELKAANTQLEEHEKELKIANTQLEKHQEELQQVNTLLEEQQEELMQQKEELQSTLENLQKTQEQLVESEKMAAIGGLVAGVAHEINTPVGIGITAISSLQEDIQRMAGLYEKGGISRKDFKEFLQSSDDVSKLIRKNLERTASLVQSFKQVSTDQVTEQQRVFALKEYLKDILVSLQPKFRGKKIDFKINCDEKLKLNSYPGVYAQIFTNLLLNSLQHGFPEMDTGTIGIKADINKELLKIQYSDDGAGISTKDLPHIFEPFYTSDHQHGAGLGLNIVYNLIKQKLHGTITCESDPGKGVLFKIEVPVK